MRANIDIVPPDRWDRDHLSMLVYVEARIVDHDARLRHEQMRRDGASHCKDGRIDGHTDWHCLRDLIAAGFVTVEGEDAESSPRRLERVCHAPARGGQQARRVGLTSRGWPLAALGRRRRGEPGSVGLSEWRGAAVASSRFRPYACDASGDMVAELVARGEGAAAIERMAVAAAIEIAGSQTKAATLLDMNRHSLRRRVRKYGIRVERKAVIQ